MCVVVVGYAVGKARCIRTACWLWSLLSVFEIVMLLQGALVRAVRTFDSSEGERRRSESNSEGIFGHRPGAF